MEARPRSGRRPAIGETEMTGDAESEELTESQGVCWIYCVEVASEPAMCFMYFCAHILIVVEHCLGGPRLDTCQGGDKVKKALSYLVDI